MTFVEFLILTLAVFRLARLIIEDTITEPARTKILSRWPGQNVEYDLADNVKGGVFPLDGKLYAQEPTATGDKVAKLLSCPWCISVWIGVLVTVAFWQWPDVTGWVMLPFALSAAAGLLSSVE